MLNYLMWHDHRDVESLAIGAELDGNEDEDQMDEMVVDIGREFEVGGDAYRRCRISTGSLSPQVRTYTMVPM
jgi:hypothetical protein